MNEAIQAYPAETIKRFWSKVAIGAPGECWPWSAGKFDNGYGAFSVGGKLVRAHRFAYGITHGPMPADQVGRHTCDNRPCCNPAHIVPGTQLENVEDRDSRGRQARGQQIHTSKLIAEVVLAIRADHRGHAPVARDYGVARSMVQRIRQRKAWSHV